MLFDESVLRSSGEKRRKKGRSILALKKLCWHKMKHLSKEQLGAVVAEHKWKNSFEEWKTSSPVAFDMTFENVSSDKINWFSQPRVDNDSKVRFHFTDACHILTCLRTKVCTSGIEGLKKKAWELAALSTDTQLNISVVVDCLDKQDVALAKRVFA